MKFNINGNTAVPTKAGQFLSFVLRVFLLVFMIERLIAWHSFERFNILTYDTPLMLNEASGYSADNLNLQKAKFEFMVGFDRNLPPEIGRIELSLLTVGADGQVSEIEILSTIPCEELAVCEEGEACDGWNGIKYVEREIGTNKEYGTDYSMQCLEFPERLGITGNKHSEYKNQ